MSVKNKRLETKLKNREVRQSQSIKVYEFKLTKLSNKTKRYLDNLFLHSKWYYNYILGSDIEPKDFNTKIINITKRDKDKNIIEVIVSLPSKIRQSLKFRIRDAIKGLGVKKAKGKTKEVGKLKFKSEIKSIELNQYGNTHRYDFQNNTITFFKHKCKILGLGQIKDKVNFVNAFIVRKADGYYIHQTCYILENKKQENKNKEKAIGIDFGIKDSLITSDSEKFNVWIPETNRLNNLSRKLDRQTKNSRNWYKTKNKIGREYLRIVNKKNDAANKLVSYLKNKYETIVIQDENLSGWHKGLFGKQVQHSILGKVKAKLIQLEQTIVIDRKFASTKTCYRCGEKVNLDLSDRVFKCPCCGLTEDRDVKAAKTILFEGLKKSLSCGTQDYRCGENVNLSEIVNSLNQKVVFSEA